MYEKDILSILEKQERKKFFSKLQHSAEEKGHIPHVSSLRIRELAHTFQNAGGMLIGIFIGIFTMVFNFLFFVWLLHLEF